MAQATTDKREPRRTTFGYVVVVIAAVFFGFMTIGIPLPVLPVFVHDELGFGTVTVGWVIAAQSIATLLSRPIAARIVDTRGPQVAAATGLCACGIAALSYSAAALLGDRPAGGLAALFLGRGALGVGESLLITGALAWGIGLAGPARTGKVMAWVGIAMYGALAAGAPLGWALLRGGGFLAVAAVLIAFPILGFVATKLAPAAAVAELPPAAFVRAMAAVWRFGGGLALATMAFGALIAFLPLLYATRHWTGTAIAFTAFGGAYVVVRLLLGGLPDRIGGRPVAGVSLLIETIGQLLLWRSATPQMAVVGAALTGCGFSLVFPALGTLAVRSAESMPRGAVLGAYVVFFDLSLAVTGPVTGVVAEHAGFPTVFLLGALGAAISLILTLLSAPATAPRITRFPMNDIPQNDLIEAAAGCRVLHSEGHADMTLGHLSFRDPRGRGVWMKRSGIGLGEVTGPADFILLGFDGQRLAGEGRIHKEWPIHTEVLSKRPDVNAVGHSHPFYATLFSSLEVDLEAVTNEAAYLGTTVARFEETRGLIDTPALGAALAQALGDASTLLLRNHGVLFVGKTIPEAVLMGVFLERACRSQMELLTTKQTYKATPKSQLSAKREQILDPNLVENFWSFYKRKADGVRALPASNVGIGK